MECPRPQGPWRMSAPGLRGGTPGPGRPALPTRDVQAAGPGAGTPPAPGPRPQCSGLKGAALGGGARPEGAGLAAAADEWPTPALSRG